MIRSDSDGSDGTDSAWERMALQIDMRVWDVGGYAAFCKAARNSLEAGAGRDRKKVCGSINAAPATRDIQSERKFTAPLTWWTTSLMLYMVHVIARSFRRMSAAPGDERLRTSQQSVAVLSAPKETTLPRSLGAAAMIVKTAWATSRTLIVRGAVVGAVGSPAILNSWKKGSMVFHSSAVGSP